MPIYALGEKEPKLGRNCFVAPTATIIGDVTLGDDVSVWFGAVIRGDVESITIGDRTNIQDNSVVHPNSNTPVVIEEDVIIGHRVVMHGQFVRKGALVGNGSVIQDHVELGEYSLVAPGAVVTDNTIVPPRSLVVGIPGKVKKELSEERVEAMRKNSLEYVHLKNRYLEEFSP